MSKVLRLSYFWVFSFVLVLFAAQAKAQPWNNNFTATANLTDVRFLDDVGSPTNGVLGGDGVIYYTTNTGTNWTAATVPAGFTGLITDFTFKDPMNGWASSVNTGSNPGLLVTADGGQTWKYVASAAAEGNAVYWSATTNRLFYASAVDSAAYTTNGGNTWVKFAGYPYTGFAFAGPKLGIMSNTTGTPNNQFYYMRTTNGGLTWSRVLMQDDTWQPVGIPGTPQFYEAGFVSNVINVSNDGGQGWVTNAAWNFPGVMLTGTMAGDGCGIFVASQNNGVFASTDDGRSWLPMGGPNGIAAGSRFYVSPTRVWVTQNKNLWWQNRPTPINLHYFPTTIAYQSAGCLTVDTVIRLTGCACGNTSITSVSISNSTGGFSILSGGNSRPFCGLDSIHVGYHPSGSGADSALLHITMLQGTTTVDSVIPLWGPGQPISVTLSSTSFTLFHGVGCHEYDTSLVLTNTLCNDLTLVSADVTAGDPYVQVLAPPLPAPINPQGSLRLPILMQATLQGTYTGVLHLKVMSSSGQVWEKDVVIRLLVDKSASPEVRTFNWTMQDICSLKDTAIVFKNTLCDTLVMTNVVNNTPGNFQLFNTGTVTLAPGDSVLIRVRLTTTTPGTYKGKLTIYSSVQGQDIQFNPAVDYSITITKALQLQPQVSPNGATFGQTSTCDSSRTITVHFQNTICLPLTISTLKFNLPNDSAYTIERTFAQGSTLNSGFGNDIVVHFWPRRQKTNGESGSISVTYTYNGNSNTVVYPVSGSGTDQVAAPLDASTFNFDSLDYCGEAYDTTYMHNSPCSDIRISAVNVLSGSGLTVVSPKPGDVVSLGQTVPVIIHFTPTAPGAVTGAVEVMISTLSGGSGASDTIHFTAAVRAPIRAYDIGAIAPDTLLACQTRDTTITLANHGQCDTMTISAISPASLVTNLAQLGLPRKLLVGESMTLNVHFDPANVVADLNGNITISASPDIVIPYHIPVKSCNTVGQIATLPMDSVLSTTNCNILARTFGVTISGGSADITITADAAPKSKLALNPNPTTGTLTAGNTFNYTVEYDPNRAGSDSLWITITSVAGNYSRRILVTGKTTGAANTARLGIEVAGGTQSANVSASASQKHDFTIVMRDAVDAATLGLQTARFHVLYNKSILTEVAITPAAGWTAGTLNTSNEGDLDLSFRYTGSGSIAANSPVATISMLAAVSDTTATPITVVQTRFNEADSTYERCKLSSASAGDVVTVNVGLACTDSLMQRLMRNEAIISGFSIRPNPVQRTGASSSLTFQTSERVGVRAELVDLMGEVVETIADAPMEKGSHSFAIPTDHLSEGTYFVRVTAGGQQTVRKFVVTK